MDIHSTYQEGPNLNSYQPKLIATAITVEPLIQDTPEIRLNRTHLAVPNTLFVYITPLKSGHLTNKNTFFCPQSVWIREVPLYRTKYTRCNIYHIPHSEFEQVTCSLPCQPHSLQTSCVVRQGNWHAEVRLSGRGRGEGGGRGVRGAECIRALA